MVCFSFSSLPGLQVWYNCMDNVSCWCENETPAMLTPLICSEEFTALSFIIFIAVSTIIVN